ncbi:MAG TPA: hypothetical protein VF433_11960 [Cellvibrio sp.]
MQTQQRFWLTTISVGLLAMAALYFFNRPQPQHKGTEINQAATRSTTQNIGDNMPSADKKITATASSGSSTDAQVMTPELQERLSEMQARRPNLHFDTNEVAAAVARTTTWTATDTVHRELPLAEEEFTDGRQFLDLDSLKIETLMPGDQINVRVAEQAKDYKVTIDRIEKHDYNSISWYGNITGDDGHKYQVSVTRGEHLTVGGLDTPDGHFVIQAHGNKGWIASSQLLFKADTSVSDAIHPADVDPNYTHPAHVH